MHSYAVASVSEQVDKIRLAVRTNGEFTAGCEELAIMCPDKFSEEDKMAALNEIAEWEGWIINTLPDDRVQFKSLRFR